MQASFLEGRNTFARFFSAVVGFSFAVAGFCNKVSAPNFYLFVLKWPSRHSHNFGAHNHLLVLCTIKCAGVMCNAQCNAMQVNPWWRWQLCWAMHDLAIKAPLTNVTLLRTMHSHTSTCLTFDKIKSILLHIFPWPNLPCTQNIRKKEKADLKHRCQTTNFHIFLNIFGVDFQFQPPKQLRREFYRIGKWPECSEMDFYIN